MSSVSSEVTVPLDPASAFSVFTDEMDLWWVRSPISFHDAARAVARRCEPGVGGRLLEVYDEALGDGLELGRFTQWEPGARIGWVSSIDDVLVEVTFVPVDGGTRVRVEATVPEGGQDRGGTSWVRVGPPWFGDWCSRRDHEPHEVREMARLAVAVHYTKPATAARWLANAFGFEMPTELPDDDVHFGWIEFPIGTGRLLLFRREGEPAEGAVPTHVPWVFVDDIDEHLARATAAGATIVEGMHQHGYRGYTAEDLEGHRWTFAQARPTM
jgi:uncharacterized glyoxalase superfamily protein PhnB